MLTVILTGGKSSRIQTDKALLNYEGYPMSLVLANRYLMLGETVFAVNRKGRFPTGNFGELEDRFPGQGPLNGLVSGFHYQNKQPIFLTATDMPGGDPWLALTLEEMLGNDDICAIERNNGKVETLFAVYSPRVAENAEKLLQSGKKSIMALYDISSVRLVRESELEDWNLNKVLFNINTKDDYIRFTQMGYVV